MKPRKEMKLLTGFLRMIDSEKRGVVTRVWFNLLLWVVAANVIVLLLKFHNAGQIGIMVVAFVSSVLGVAIGVIAMLQNGETQWPILKRHINRESVEDRLRELNQHTLDGGHNGPSSREQ